MLAFSFPRPTFRGGPPPDSPARTLTPIGLAVLSFCAFVSTSIVYVAASQYDLFDPATGGTEGDSALYARMSDGADLEEIPKPFRYRVVVPFLAGLLPRVDLSATGFATVGTGVQLSFAAVNLVALTLAGWFLFLFLRRLEFDLWQSLLGLFFFYSSWIVIRFSGAVLVDAAAFAALALLCYAAMARRTVLLMIGFTVGMFVKETTVLAVLIIVLLNHPWRVRAAQAAVCVPGLLGYLVFRLLLYPTDSGTHYTFERVSAALAAMTHPGTAAHALIELALTFGPLWVIAPLGLRHARRRVLPRRLAAAVPLVLLIPFLIDSNYGRIWFLAFPVMIPFAVAGVLHLQHLIVRRTPDDPPADPVRTPVDHPFERFIPTAGESPSGP